MGKIKGNNFDNDTMLSKTKVMWSPALIKVISTSSLPLSFTHTDFVTTVLVHCLRDLPLNPGVVSPSPIYGHKHDPHMTQVHVGLRKRAQKRIYLCCDNMFHKLKINMFKLKQLINRQNTKVLKKDPQLIKYRSKKVSLY